MPRTLQSLKQYHRGSEKFHYSPEKFYYNPVSMHHQKPTSYIGYYDREVVLPSHIPGYVLVRNDYHQQCKTVNSTGMKVSSGDHFVGEKKFSERPQSPFHYDDVHANCQKRARIDMDDRQCLREVERFERSLPQENFGHHMPRPGKSRLDFHVNRIYENILNSRSGPPMPIKPVPIKVEEIKPEPQNNHTNDMPKLVDMRRVKPNHPAEIFKEEVNQPKISDQIVPCFIPYPSNYPKQNSPSAGDKVKPTTVPSDAESQDALVECPECFKTMKSKGSLRRHMLIHRGVKPFQCHICQARFRQKHHLQGHVLLHTGERPHACELCGKRFRIKHHLVEHNKTSVNCLEDAQKREEQIKVKKEQQQLKNMDELHFKQNEEDSDSKKKIKHKNDKEDSFVFLKQ